MPSPADVVADAEAIGLEHGFEGMHRLAERAGVELDGELALAAWEQSHKLALATDVPEDVANHRVGSVMTSIGVVWMYAFLVGALYAKQHDEGEND